MSDKSERFTGFFGEILDAIEAEDYVRLAILADISEIAMISAGRRSRIRAPRRGESEFCRKITDFNRAKIAEEEKKIKDLVAKWSGGE